MIKITSDLRQVGGFLQVLRFPPIKTDRDDIADRLLKVTLNTIKQTIKHERGKDHEFLRQVKHCDTDTP